MVFYLDPEKQQMQETIKVLDAAVKNKEDEITAKVQIASMKTEAEAHRAHIDLLKEKIKQHGDMTKHAVDTAINLHHKKIDMENSPDELSEKNEGVDNE